MDIINNPQSATSTYKASLGGETYTINQRFNTRTQSWYLDVFNSNGDTLVLGRKILPNVPIIVRNRDLMFGGNLATISTDIVKTNPVSRGNLGLDEEYNIIYYTSEDFI